MSENFLTAQPRYVRVAGVLLQDIRSGRYRKGDMLPTEVELCERFSVSRATVREALRRLGEMGMIVKIHGVGTRVESEEVQSNFLVSVHVIQDNMEYAGKTCFVEFSRARLSAAEAMERVPGWPAGVEALALRGYRRTLTDEQAISSSEILLNTAFADVAKEPLPRGLKYHQAIVQRYDQQIQAIDQDIRATSLTAEHARVLGVKARSAGLLVVRRFLGLNDELLQASINVHPAERFTYRMRLRKTADA